MEILRVTAFVKVQVEPRDCNRGMLTETVRYVHRFDKRHMTGDDDALNLERSPMRLGVVFGVVLAVILAAVLWRRGKPPLP